MEKTRDINVARSYAKKQGYDCFITKCKRGNYRVKGCYEFKGVKPSTFVEIVRHIANKDILSNPKNSKPEPPKKRRRKSKSKTKPEPTKSIAK